MSAHAGFVLAHFRNFVEHEIEDSALYCVHLAMLLSAEVQRTGVIATDFKSITRYAPVRNEAAQKNLNVRKRSSENCPS